MSGGDIYNLLTPICEAEDEEHTDEHEDAVILPLCWVNHHSERENNCIFIFTPQEPRRTTPTPITNTFCRHIQFVDYNF